MTRQVYSAAVLSESFVTNTNDHKFWAATPKTAKGPCNAVATIPIMLNSMLKTFSRGMTQSHFRLRLFGEILNQEI